MMSHKMNITDDVEMVRLAFRTLDKDGSGSICTHEFKHLMTHIGKLACQGMPNQCKTPVFMKEGLAHCYYTTVIGNDFLVTWYFRQIY